MRKAFALAAAVVLVFAALAAFTTCRSTPNGGARGSTPTAGRPSPGAVPSPRPTAAPAVTPMPVTTPEGASRYDREPGVLYEETAPPTVAPSGTPTRRPAAPATRTPSPR
jgi:hypothetical protein